jgi:hypothetical protein
MIKSGFEEFVFQHQTLMLRQPLIDLAQRLRDPILPPAQVRLTGVVRTIGKPNFQIP